MSREIIKISKFLSLVLRHRPQSIGLTLDAHGWADIDDLLARAARHGRAITRDALLQAVAENDKQRFSLSDDGCCIRARQGHSIAVDLELEPRAPPGRLFHGTVEVYLPSIRREGLRKRTRQHVHLSPDIATAEKVGGRRGRPLVLVVESGRMASAGHEFYLSENGVWLTEHVPPEFLVFPPEFRGL